ncbi:riboflavin synthase [Ligilactobacillus sp. WILCCON 0076]|uniref:Riboflavin synthase n=1 Tax=Ligilactobacillus ubinensis TaxID=2876789 RepID=A0A9X2FLL3_9LACO|nr:riboflavin synthase [Ligilactobacillus ubinensis]MCP0886608.1 riboflavin synthase [Ligilactobacillus ubinensis]
MFTGIIKSVGKIKFITTTQNTSHIGISTSLTKQIHTNIGDSIAINGVCLTVTAFSKHGFEVDIMPETMRRTTLDNLLAGQKVNIEPALLLSSRLDGHLVLGHIDTIATLTNIIFETNSRTLIFKLPVAYTNYVVEKGSIAIDGVSLTVASKNNTLFSISLIPHTLTKTTLENLKIGDQVNIETDILGKYILQDTEANYDEKY